VAGKRTPATQRAEAVETGCSRRLFSPDEAAELFARVVAKL